MRNFFSKKNRRSWQHWLLAFALINTVVVSCLVLLISNSISIPYLFADEWVVTYTIASNPFPDSIFAGHNGVPSYFQNALWLLDFRLFNYEGIIPRLAMLCGLVLGIFCLIILLKQIDIPQKITYWILVLFLSLWFSYSNRMHYGEYIWRGVESSLLLLSISIALILAVNYLKIAGNAENKSEIPMIGLIFLVAWFAIYVHGGFPILPLIAFALGISTRSWKTRIGISIITLFFIWHFTQVHYLHAAKPEPVEESFKNFLLGLMILPSAIPYNLIGQIVNKGAAAYMGCLITISGVLILFIAIYRLISGKDKDVSIIIFFFIAYPLLISLAIAYARVQYPPGWSTVLSPRYANYSIYFFIGITLAILRLTHENLQSNLLRVFRWAFLLVIILIGSLGWLESLSNFKNLGLSNAHNQAYMVPFTLEDWTLPPRRLHTTPRRQEYSAKFHHVLQDHRKNVFGSRQYLAYATALTNDFSLDNAPECDITWDFFRTDPVDDGLIVELRGRLDQSWGKLPGNVVFLGLNSKPLGWAPRFSEWRIVNQSVVVGAHKSGNIVWGYFRSGAFPETTSIHALLVSEKNEVLCITKRIAGIK